MSHLIFSILFVFTFGCKNGGNPLFENGVGTGITSFKMFSVNVADTFVIDVSLPKSYTADKSRKYHVLYLTDGYWRKEQHQPIHDMAKKENVKEMIIVGIGYPNGYDPNSIRVRDLITRADKFLDFVCKELIRRIDSGYQTNSGRTLWGSSFGGFFGMYALFNYPEKTKGVFQNYIIASAAALEKTNYNNEFMDLFDLEKLLNSKTTELPVNLYITVGGIEDPGRFLNPFKDLVKILVERNYKSFFMKSYIDPGKDHYTVWEPTLYEGIRMFMKNN